LADDRKLKNPKKYPPNNKPSPGPADYKYEDAEIYKKAKTF